jgi:hypothetical protein
MKPVATYESGILEIKTLSHRSSKENGRLTYLHQTINRRKAVKEERHMRFRAHEQARELAAPPGSVPVAADGLVPDFIAGAGENAVAAYRTFLDTSARSLLTRKQYQKRIKQFCDWAKGRGLPLAMIAAADVGAYGALIVASRPPHATYVVLTPVRGLFRHLAGSPSGI